MKTFVLLALMSNFISSCSVRGAITDTTISDLPSTTYSNVAYGADPKQVMDIYLPAGRSGSSTKIVFLIHGGSWSGGDKTSFYSYMDSLKKHLPDYALVNINYRLANFTQNKFPTQENDIKSALTTFMSKTGDYNISRDVVLLGASAGAHLALLQAYKYTDPVKVKAVVSFFGPTDIADMYNSPAYPQVPELLQLLLGGTPTSDPEVYRQSSPISFVTTETCPTLIFQGGKDLLVNPRQATILEDTLKKAGVITELIIYPDEGHGWRGLSLGDSFEKIGDFLKENVE